MHEMFESHVSINAKQYAPFKRSLFTLLSYVKGFTVQHRTHALQCKGSWTVSHSCEIKNLATILLLCVMTSHFIPIGSPLRELSNLYLKGVPPSRRKLLLIFHRYVNSTCILYFFCVFQVMLISLAAYLGFMTHRPKHPCTPNKMTVVSAL